MKALARNIARGSLMQNELRRRMRLRAIHVRGYLHRRARPTRWGNMRRLEPFDSRFGMGRGTPIDRTYIEMFLREHSHLVRGTVLEVGDARYSVMFGGAHVTQQSILDANAANTAATIVGDLARGLPEHEGSFDCLLVTQVLPFIYDTHAAVRTIRALCKPGGTALITLPGISQVSRYDMNRWGDFWRFTDRSAMLLFEEVFGADNVLVTTFGNVLTATAQLYGLSAEELTCEEMLYHHPDYQVVIGVVARASSSSATIGPAA